MSNMTKYELVEKIKELLMTDIDLNFLLDLKKEEIERLVAIIRERVDLKNVDNFSLNLFWYSPTSIYWTEIEDLCALCHVDRNSDMIKERLAGRL